MPAEPDVKPREKTICKHCGRSGGMTSVEVLRAGGWRLFEGVSQTGKPLSDVVCPWCAGTVETPPPGWKVRCRTCDWEYEDEDDEPLDAKPAKQVARDHECEPWVEISPPGSERWGGPSWFNNDGSEVKRGV